MYPVTSSSYASSANGLLGRAGVTPVRLVLGASCVSLALAAAACGDATTGSPSAVGQTSARVSGYRFVRPPLIVRDDVSHDVSDVTVYFRLNRRLPNGAYGEVDGEPPASRAVTSFVPDNERCSMQYAAPLPVQKNANGIGSEGLAYERRLHCLRDGRAR
jgi:hypothetical protein